MLGGGGDGKKGDELKLITLTRTGCDGCSSLNLICGKSWTPRCPTSQIEAHSPLKGCGLLFLTLDKTLNL